MDKLNIQNIINKFDKKENSISEVVKQTSPEKRVSKLIELGVLSDLEGYTWGSSGGDRFYVFANIQGVPVPMYQTSARTDGKREDVNFFPFFGIQNNGQTWIIKGDIQTEVNTFHNIKQLEDTSKILTEAFNFDTDRKQKIQEKQTENIPTSSPASALSKLESYKEVDGYVPEGNEIKGHEKLNELLSKRFGIDFNEINKKPRTSREAVELASGKILGNLK